MLILRCLARCKMLETFHNIVDEWPCDYFGGGGRWGGGEVGGKLCPTQAHAACDTLLMLGSEPFPVTFWAGLDAMLRIFSCNLSMMAHLEDVVSLQDSWHVARCLARCKMLETFHNIVDEWPGDYCWGGGVGGKVGWGEVAFPFEGALENYVTTPADKSERQHFFLHAVCC